MLVGWQREDNRVYYAVTANGWVSWIWDALPLPSSDCTVNNQYDVTATVLQDPSDALLNGSLYLACGINFVDDAATGVFQIARKPAGAAAIADNTIAVGCGAWDKDMLAIGPWPPSPFPPPVNTTRVAYLGFGEESNLRLDRARSADVAPAGGHWSLDPSAIAHVTSTSGAPTTGIGALPLVVSGGAASGRLLYFSGPSAQGLAEVTSSDSGGDAGTWRNKQRLDRYGASSPIVNITSGLTHTPITGQLADVPSFVSASALPSNPNTVIAAFTAKDADPATVNNLDIFIALCTNASTGLAIDPLWQSSANGTLVVNQTFRILDSWLRASGEADVESDEFLPAVTFDGLGGVNLVFCRSQQPDSTPFADARVTIRYARWSSISEIQAGHAPSVLKDLSPPFQPWGLQQDNDYMMITASSCHVYAAWAGQQSGTWQVYMSHIVVSNTCTADVLVDGQVTSSDAVTFGQAFAAGLAPADVNGDGLIDAHDAVDFLEAYSCSSCPP